MELLQLAQVLGLAALVSCCSPPYNWRSKPMLERVKRSELLVYGQVREIIQRDTDTYYKEMEYKIDVSCILRNNMNPRPNIGASISVFEMYPPAECVSNRFAMQEGKKVILMLTEDYREEGRLKFHNINVQRAVFDGSEANLAAIAESCNFSQMTTPSGAINPHCPLQAC